MKLSELNKEEKAVITGVRGQGAFRKRITEMGFVKGTEVTLVKHAPLRDPVQYELMGYQISLRRSEAELIEVLTKDEAGKLFNADFSGTLPDAIFKRTVNSKAKTINVAFIGNPNCGKTTLFNAASGARQKVGNYSGVTVDVHTAKFQQDGYLFNITDLPGTYSLSAYSPEEIFVRQHIIEAQPDVVVNIVDATNLERNLFLTTQLIDMNIPVVMALNMYDELNKKGITLDLHQLSEMLGIPMVPTVGFRKKGIEELFKKVIEVRESKEEKHVNISHGRYIEEEIEALEMLISKEENKRITDVLSPRFIAVKLLEKDELALKLLKQAENREEIQRRALSAIQTLEAEYKEDSETVIADAKYGFISGAMKATFTREGIDKRHRTEIIDSFLTNKYWGFPVFIFFMWLMFQATFTIGQYPMDWIDTLVGSFGELLQGSMADGPLKDLLIDGVIGGVGGVIVFLPNILILFFFISLMEDTGYIARAAFIMDRLMRAIGLHGRSFIPLVMGFGCNVPAVMATRTIEDKENRLLTMLIAPFMSCSARLPVYILLIGAFFPEYPGTVLFSMYFIGIILAVLVALLFKRFIFKAPASPFVMELPPYRIPTGKALVLHAWRNAYQYLQKMGGMILISSVIIWALTYFPRDPQQSTAQQMENSFMGKMGHAIEPVIEPLGFDWKMGVSLITGMAAKEIVVSTMGVLYQGEGGENENSATLKKRLQEHTYQQGEKQGQKVFSPLSAFAFMLFILIYFPCVAVVAAVKKESGGWRWAVFMMVYTTGMAWILSFLVYQVGSIFV
ncbi:MAG: ferrous iron transport protein B [Flavobacteriales bacterium]